MVTAATYDVFLSHAGKGKPAVEDLARRLKLAGLEPFLDKWHLARSCSNFSTCRSRPRPGKSDHQRQAPRSEGPPLCL